MAPARGISFLFPVVPILCIISAILLLALIPGFWKTGVFALLALVAWLFIGNMLILIGMIGWRANIHDAPIFADIIAQLWNIWFVGAFASMAAFSKFVWLRLRPSSARELYDHRRKNNIIDACITILIPLLWVPMFLISCSARYYIVEDLGPIGAIWLDWPGFFLTIAPLAIPTVTMAVFNFLAVFCYWRYHRGSKPTDNTSKDARVRTQKLLIFSLWNLVLALFAIGYTVGLVFQHNPPSTWGSPVSLAKSIAALKIVRFMDRYWLEKQSPLVYNATISRLISMPLLGIHLFAWFGFSAEARKSYQEAFARLSRLLAIKPKPAQTESIEKPISRWSTMLARLKPHWKSSDILPTTADVKPFAWSPTGSGESLPSKHEEAHCADASEEVVETKLGKKKCGTQSAIRRLSIHKPPLPSSVPVNASSSPTSAGSDVARRLSFHKPPLPPSSAANASTPPEIDSARRMSFHKPPLPSSVPANVASLPVATALDVARRLSFHKPPLPSLDPVTTSALPAAAALGITPQTDQNEGQIPREALHIPTPPNPPSRPPPAPRVVPSSIPPTYRV